jgi:hypothetical protein
MAKKSADQGGGGGGGGGYGQRPSGGACYNCGADAQKSMRLRPGPPLTPPSRPTRNSPPPPFRSSGKDGR